MAERAVNSQGPGTGRAAGPGPAAAAPFLGRRGELAGLRADVGRAGLDTLAGHASARCRVLLIAGRPGTGRTALAEEFAKEWAAAGECPDGVLRARLTGPGREPADTGRVARDLLGAVGRQPPPGAPDEDLTALLRDCLHGRRALLLLDDVHSAGQLAEFVPDGRGCLVLAVSGGPLTGVSDVRPCTLGGLDQPAAVRMLARGAGGTRITVDPRAAESLAEACGHLPAALALAAGWLWARPEAAVAHALRALRESGPEGPGDVAEPLRRAFRLACSALTGTALRTLRLLALAPAGLADAHTAAALSGCPVPSAAAVLEELAARGLLHVVPEGPAGRPGRGSAPWYAVPGCLEPLLLGLLRDGERPAEARLARARTLERTVRRLRSCRAEAEPCGSPGREWLDTVPASLRFTDRAAAAHWLETALPVLRAAADDAAVGGDLDTLTQRLADALIGALEAHRGRERAAAEVYPLYELIARTAGRRGLPRRAAAALLSLGDLDAGAGRRDRALTRYRGALETAGAEGDRADPVTLGRAAESIGATYAELEDWQRAADWYGRALARCLSRDDREGSARLHGRIGAALTRAGQWEEALRAWRAAAAAHRRLGDEARYVRALSEMAGVLELAGRPGEARRTAREALRRAERCGDPRSQSALRSLLERAAPETESSAVTEQASCETQSHRD
ncbi:tetratricopeptide repeat protein [Streptomyces sodiiphilus]|uniref:tetratricopeptide repeat protein n=1 Tax=Streptomyces sodiiphilus TaxID=226217 RepID=UPI0031D2B34B